MGSALLLGAMFLFKLAIFDVTGLFVRVSMPYCIAVCCRNRDDNCATGVSFHRLPVKDPVLLKQVSFATRICPNVFFSLLVIVAREMWCD